MGFATLRALDTQVTDAIPSSRVRTANECQPRSPETAVQRASRRKMKQLAISTYHRRWVLQGLHACRPGAECVPSSHFHSVINFCYRTVTPSNYNAGHMPRSPSLYRRTHRPPCCKATNGRNEGYLTPPLQASYRSGTSWRSVPAWEGHKPPQLCSASCKGAGAGVVVLASGRA